MSKMRRGNRPGLWVSTCGRFTVRRLGGGNWMVSPLHAPTGSGPFSRRIGEQILAQRFHTRQQAADALDVIIEIHHQQQPTVELDWKRQQAGEWVAQYEGDILQANRVAGLWRVAAVPANLYQAKQELVRAEKDGGADRDSAFSINLAISSHTVYLGSARTLAQAKILVGEELAWKDA